MSNQLLYQTVVGALAYDDYKGVNSQYVEQDKLIIEVYAGGGLCSGN